MISYFDALCNAMEMLADNPKTIFMGQAVKYPGTAMYRTLAKVPDTQKLELPVAEDMQLGMAIGMSLNGYIPICIYPRWNFLLLAMNQLVLHLDKLPIYSRYKPKVIIRTAVATREPMDPGPQHLGDFTHAFKDILKTVCVSRFRLQENSAIIPAYQRALQDDNSWLMVEYLENY